MKQLDPNYLSAKFHDHDIISLEFTGHSLHPSFPKNKLKCKKKPLKSRSRADGGTLKTPGIPIVTDTGEQTNQGGWGPTREWTNEHFCSVKNLGAERLFQFTINQSRSDFKTTSHVMLDHGAASFKGLFQICYILTKLSQAPLQFSTLGVMLRHNYCTGTNLSNVGSTMWTPHEHLF